MNGGVGFSGEGAKGVSMMQHGHLILLQLEAMNLCMICQCSQCPTSVAYPERVLRVLEHLPRPKL